MSSTLEQLTGSVEGLRDLLISFDAGPVDDSDRDGTEAVDPRDCWEWADGTLEAYALVRHDYTGTGGVQSVTVVTGTGGPHVEVTCEMRGDGSFHAEGWWGTDHVVRHGTSAAFESFCDDYVAGLSYGWGE